MQASELRDLSEQELNLKLKELRESLFMLRLRHATSQLENPAKLAEARRDIARINTVQRQRQLKGKAS
jgi:large subunit ribosomal protein L29